MVVVFDLRTASDFRAYESEFRIRIFPNFFSAKAHFLGFEGGLELVYDAMRFNRYILFLHNECVCIKVCHILFLHVGVFSV